MDAQSTTFWQSVLMALIAMLQSVVNLVIWEKHSKVDNAPGTEDNTRQ